MTNFIALPSTFRPSNPHLTPKDLIRELGKWGRTPTPGLTPTPIGKSSREPTPQDIADQVQEFANGSFAEMLEKALMLEWGIQTAQKESTEEAPRNDGNGSYEDMIQMD